MKDAINKSILKIYNEVNSKMDKRNRISHTKYEVQTEERKDIILNAGDSALLLYQFYLRMAAIPDQSMEDSDASKFFNWTLQKTRKCRNRLEKLGYFKKITYSATNGKKSVTYYLSKERVAKS